jgi:hypothetical protein
MGGGVGNLVTEVCTLRNLQDKTNPATNGGVSIGEQNEDQSDSS